jgi:hypothetical protein
MLRAARSQHLIASETSAWKMPTWCLPNHALEQTNAGLSAAPAPRPASRVNAGWRARPRPRLLEAP